MSEPQSTQTRHHTLLSHSEELLDGCIFHPANSTTGIHFCFGERLDGQDFCEDHIKYKKEGRIYDSIAMRLYKLSQLGDVDVCQYEAYPNFISICTNQMTGVFTKLCTYHENKLFDRVMDKSKDAQNYKKLMESYLKPGVEFKEACKQREYDEPDTSDEEFIDDSDEESDYESEDEPEAEFADGSDDESDDDSDDDKPILRPTKRQKYA